MQEAVFFDGGRPLYDDDLVTIQVEAQTAATAVLAGLGRDCVVAGCGVGGTTIGAGLVYIGGKLLRFLGASNVTFPASLIASNVAVVQDDRDYEDGINHPAIQEVFAVVQAGVASGVPVYAQGGLTLQHLLRAAQWEVGDVKSGQLVSADYDAATGKGLPGTAAWGWALADGQNGRPDLRGRFIVGVDPSVTEFSTVGNVGGASKVKLTLSQLPGFDTTPNNGRITFDGGNSSGYAMQYTTNKTRIGQDQEHENLPPYYALAMKIWIGF
jgi:hypothetical protein